MRGMHFDCAQMGRLLGAFGSDARMRGMHFDSAEMRRLLGAFRDYNVRASVLASRALLAVCALFSFSTDHVTILQ